MAKLGYPNITVAFSERGIAAIGRSQRGILAMILDEKEVSALKEAYYTVYDITDIPQGLSETNKEQVTMALIGYQTTPKHILLLVRQVPTETDYTKELNQLETLRWDYLVIPDIKPESTEAITTWIKALRTGRNDKRVKAVLPNTAADFEGVVNYVNKTVTTTAGTYDTAHFCSRIAGLICGTPMTISCTFAPLPDVVSTEHHTIDEMDTMIGQGQLLIAYDGIKYKVARGINSLVTTSQGKLNRFKKVKLIDLMDMIHDDIKETARDEYIGKYANSYDNKCLLIAAINGYFWKLENDGLLAKGQNSCSIDIGAVKAYLLANGRKTKAELSSMKDIEIAKEDTEDEVFLKANVTLLDAIENITLNISI